LFVGPHAPGSGNSATVGWLLIPAESTPLDGDERAQIARDYRRVGVQTRTLAAVG
jgi:hypothetical protein